jgi:S1-C subfamily serine protease
VEIIGSFLLKRSAVMTQRNALVRSGWGVSLLALSFLALFILGLAQPNRAAAEDKDLSGLVAKVDPCVVTIRMQHSTGSGFVVDAGGILITNYHVIEGAKEAVAIFPDKSKYLIKGFYVIKPKWDIAILRIEPQQGKTLHALSLAKELPGKGQRVFAFGAPLGMSASVSEGIVAALRTGDEISEILSQGGDKDVFNDILGYDKKTQWIQTTSPISPGNSGGPLVNADGEVLGINTWQSRIGQNLNFTISALHVQELYKQKGTEVHPLSALPKPREHEEEGDDGGKTLATWKKMNRLKIELSKKIAPVEKRLATIVPTDPRNPIKGLSGRMKLKATHYHALGEIYADFSQKVKALKMADVDPKVVGLSYVETELTQKISELCEEGSAAAKAGSAEQFLADEDAYHQGVGEAMSKMRSKHNLLRLELTATYHKEFPTIEETAKEVAADETAAAKEVAGDESGTAKEPASDESGTAKAKAKGQDDKDRSAMRTWTDTSGSFHVEAKFRDVKDGKARLERANGQVISVPMAKLSDADRQFIGEEK